MILHIPHASTQTLEYKVNNLQRELLRMTDHFTDELFTHSNATRVVFGVSRLICDVERFEDDSQESMSRFGMGVCYTKDTLGDELRKVTKEEKQNILDKFYHPHHLALQNAVDKELQENQTALIIDCHSFPDETYYFNSDFKTTRPDICIGTDTFHTPKKVLHKVKQFFLSKGYDVRVDTPYDGTIIPLKHYQQNSNVHSLMIELNRKLYMDEYGYKTEHYSLLKEELSELLKLL